ncbi:MAG: cation-translocating P-type ATPase [Oscillospiraceae bacterium]|jgi:heavy metal translocating P-type ATPase|nr:cation-translocating P-type ATPase [Oscillospiraceae bacterium]
MKRIFVFLSGLKMTLAGGVFLAASLVLMLLKIKSPIDPAWAAAIISGLPIGYAAVRELFEERCISSELLITIAMIASVAIGELFAAGEIAFIMAIGAILEEKTVERAKKGLHKLINLAPAQGRRIGGGHEEMVSVERIRAGDILRVLPGETIPADGEIIAGDTSVDQSIMTGESLPIDKSAGDSVYCGTVNCFGSIDIKATKVSEDSSLQKLIRMVKEAEDNKAPMQRIVDKWAAWLVPIALLIAVVSYIITKDITRAVTVLVVFCPCALALATPTSIMAAIGQATKHGVIIKSGDALERMGKVDCIAFDKTGTLTYGNLAVSDIIVFDPSLSEDGFLILAASAEAYSEHPLGKAILAHAKEKKLDMLPAEDFRMIPGKGINAVIGGRRTLCGNIAYLQDNGVNIEESSVSVLESLRKQGKAVILVSGDRRCLGAVALSDTLRPSARGMVQELRKTQTEAVLLTGDHARTAEHFAGLAGITSVCAGLLPAGKVEKIVELQRQKHIVCMIGDGVNDAPALKTANVGVAMGGMGSDIAVEAADIALMGDDISKIPYLKRLSNATVKLIRFNISLSMFINFAAIILSVLALLNPVTGALVHNIGSVLVVLNAALLYDRKYVH